MNFIARNLGWILLLFFFLFMLFVISSNGTSNGKNVSSLSGITQSGAEEKLDTLIKKIDIDGEVEEEKEEESGEKNNVNLKNSKPLLSFLGWGKSEEEKEIIKNEVSDRESRFTFFGWGKTKSTEEIYIPENEGTEEVLKSSKEDEKAEMEEEIEIENEVEEEKEGFLKKIFSKKENKEEKISDEIVLEEKVEDKGKEVKIVKESQVDTDDIGGLKKNSGQVKSVISKEAMQFAPEVFNAITFPGTHLTSEVGKDFEVGVHSLKLNNKYFNETLAYMLKGDTLKQLGEENSYGCFHVEVLKSSVDKNTGKRGYVCKKYLQDTPTVESHEDTSHENIVQVQSTQIGELITIEGTTLLSNGVILQAGDVVDQMSSLDASGCISVHVYESVNQSILGQVGKLCK